MTAEQILAMRYSSEIFPAGSDLKAIYKNLIKQWHPDICKHPKASIVFQRIINLYQTAVRSVTVFDDTAYNESEHPLGLRYLYLKDIRYVVHDKNERYIENAVSMTKFEYRSSRIKEYFEPILPKCTSDAPNAINIKRPATAYQLKSVLDYYDGAIPHKTVAWIMSRLMNLLCFFEAHGFVHNGIEIDSCFMDYKTHRIYLLGGWFYARPAGEKLIGVPQSVYTVMPVKLKSIKAAGIETDIESVKQMGRLLLGRQYDAAPAPVKAWLDMGASDKAISEYERWEEAIIKAYGGRRWTPLDIEEQNLKELETRSS